MAHFEFLRHTNHVSSLHEFANYVGLGLYYVEVHTYSQLIPSQTAYTTSEHYLLTCECTPACKSITPVN